MTASDEQFAASLWAKLFADDQGIGCQPFEDGDGVSMMADWIVAMYKDHESSQQPHVDAAIQYLDPSASS